MRPSSVLPDRPDSSFTSPRLRDATTADAAALSALWAKARPTARIEPAEFRRWLATGRAKVVVGNGGQLVAALRYWEEGGGWRVEPIVSDPAHRGQGFGRWMMTILEADAVKGNVPFLALTAQDASTLPYYRRLGYRATGDEELSLRKRVGGMWQQQENPE